MYDDFDGNYKKLVGSVIVNKHGQEVLMPQFKNIEEIENLVPKSISKMHQENLQERINDLEQVLDEQEEIENRHNSGYIKKLNLSDSSYMHQLIIKEQVRTLDSYFQNDFFLCFTQIPTREDLEKRALILAKVFMKNRTQKKQENQQILQTQQTKQIEEQDKSIVIQQKRNLTSLFYNQETQEYDNQDINHQLYDKVDEVYNNIASAIDLKVYENYEKGDLDKCIEWKQKRADLDSDMDNVQDPEQLLRILNLFKVHYNL